MKIQAGEIVQVNGIAWVVITGQEYLNHNDGLVQVVPIESAIPKWSTDVDLGSRIAGVARCNLVRTFPKEVLVRHEDWIDGDTLAVVRQHVAVLIGIEESDF